MRRYLRYIVPVLIEFAGVLFVYFTAKNNGFEAGYAVAVYFTGQAFLTLVGLVGCVIAAQ